MKHLTLVLSLLASIGLAQAASHEHQMEHDMSGHDMSSHQMPAMHQGMGVVKAINEKNGKVQIAHEPIPSLQWPAMTMWFEMDKRKLHGLKVGDSVHFEMMQNEKKKWVIEKIGK